MKSYFIFLLSMCLPIVALGQVSLLGGRSEAEMRAYWEEDARRTEQYNRWLDEHNRRAQESIDAIEDALHIAIRRSVSTQGHTSNKATVTTARARSGLMISTDNSTVSTTSARTARSQQRKHQREQEQRECLLRQEEIAKQRRLQAAERRRQEEKRRRQEHYDRVYTTEYKREEYRSRRLSDEADWRVGEGADIMDRTHTASSLMTASTQRNFGSSSSCSVRKHSIRSLSHRSTAIVGLDPYAIPWATMSADARPWDEWNASHPIRDIVPSIPVQSVVPLISSELWIHIQDDLGKEKTDMIRAVVNNECNGVIPEIRYEASDGHYYLYDQESHKVISIDGDGSSIMVHQLTEKEDRFSDIWENIKKSATLSMDINAAKSLSSTVSITPGSDKEFVSYSGKVGNLSGRISNKGYSVTAGDVIGKGDYNSGDIEVVVDVAKKTIPLGGELESKEKTEFGGNLSASIKAIEISSQITHRKYILSSNASSPSIGIGSAYGVGITAKASATTFAELRKSGVAYGAEVKGEVSLAKGSLDATVMVRPPLYGGMCFATISLEGKAGYAYSFKIENGSGISSKVRGRNIGGLPLSLSGAGALKCYQPQEYSLLQSETSKP